jgi:murein L,D-transpeptidase YcbB/YkuD|tara:strand:- start:55 stop:324 length:270 start_codon:yes stop_codon:yes gene_type:complete
MAFKMKGFPLRSGFAHADTKHEDGDHQHVEQEEDKSKLVAGKYTMEEMEEMLKQYQQDYGPDKDGKPGLGTIRFRNEFPKTWQKLTFGQ